MPLAGAASAIGRSAQASHSVLQARSALSPHDVSLGLVCVWAAGMGPAHAFTAHARPLGLPVLLTACCCYCIAITALLSLLLLLVLPLRLRLQSLLLPTPSPRAQAITTHPSTHPRRCTAAHAPGPALSRFQPSRASLADSCLSPCHNRRNEKKGSPVAK